MQKIDLDSVFIKKNPRLHKLLPSFVLNYLKKVVHQEELNDFIGEHGEKTGLDFTKSALETLRITYDVSFEEPLDKTKKYILTSNHPLGGPDGIILLDYFGRYFDKVLFPVNDILLEIKNVSEFFVPINKHGAQSRKAAQLMDEAFASDAQILLFPAGLVSRKKRGVIKDLEWKKTFVARAKKYERHVVPVHISGRNSSFFYNLANIRTFFKIKYNIEMLYLADELFKQQGKNFEIKVGKPINYNTFDKSKAPQQWAEYVRKKVYDL